MKQLQKNIVCFFLIFFTFWAMTLTTSFGQDGLIVFKSSELSILSSGHRYQFNIEIADTDRHRARGLMFRKTLPKTSGMLFLFESRQMITMWMKNTFIPLDIIFIDQKGVIVHIVKSTIPESLEYIYSQVPTSAVLELNAGVTSDHNIQVGDIILYSTFK